MLYYLPLSIMEQYEFACNSYSNWYSNPKVPDNIDSYATSFFDEYVFDMRRQQLIEEALLLETEAQHLRDQGSYNEAIEKYEESINTIPTIGAFVGLGFSYSFIHQYISAMNIFTDTLAACTHLNLDNVVPEILFYRALTIASLLERSNQLRKYKSAELVTMATNDLKKCMKLKESMGLPHTEETTLFLKLFRLYGEFE